MSPQEVSGYITSLLRSEPETIASFFMGVLLTGTLAFALRHRLFPKKEAQIAIARVEVNLASLGGERSENVELVSIFPQEGPLSPVDCVATQERCAQLEGKNRELVRLKESLEQTIEDLRKDLARVSGELAHTAKWLKVFEEENARLTESGSLAED